MFLNSPNKKAFQLKVNRSIANRCKGVCGAWCPCGKGSLGSHTVLCVIFPDWKMPSHFFKFSSQSWNLYSCCMGTTPVNIQTDMTENITFPLITCVGDNKSNFDSISFHKNTTKVKFSVTNDYKCYHCVPLLVCALLVPKNLSRPQLLSSSEASAGTRKCLPLLTAWHC